MKFFKQLLNLFTAPKSPAVFGACACKCHLHGNISGPGCGWCAPCAPGHVLCNKCGNFYKPEHDHICEYKTK
jgi:hypothetical protein